MHLGLHFDPDLEAAPTVLYSSLQRYFSFSFEVMESCSILSLEQTNTPV